MKQIFFFYLLLYPFFLHSMPTSFPNVMKFPRERSETEGETTSWERISYLDHYLDSPSASETLRSSLEKTPPLRVSDDVPSFRKRPHTMAHDFLSKRVRGSEAWKKSKEHSSRLGDALPPMPTMLLESPKVETARQFYQREARLYGGLPRGLRPNLMGTETRIKSHNKEFYYPPQSVSLVSLPNPLLEVLEQTIAEQEEAEILLNEVLRGLNHETLVFSQSVGDAMAGYPSPNAYVEKLVQYNNLKQQIEDHVKEKQENKLKAKLQKLTVTVFLKGGKQSSGIILSQNIILLTLHGILDSLDSCHGDTLCLGSIEAIAFRLKGLPSETKVAYVTLDHGKNHICYNCNIKLVRNPDLMLLVLKDPLPLKEEDLLQVAPLHETYSESLFLTYGNMKNIPFNPELTSERISLQVPPHFEEVAESKEDRDYLVFKRSGLKDFGDSGTPLVIIPQKGHYEGALLVGMFRGFFGAHHQQEGYLCVAPFLPLLFD
jgi:hypothetical protein